MTNMGLTADEALDLYRVLCAKRLKLQRESFPAIISPNIHRFGDRQALMQSRCFSILENGTNGGNIILTKLMILSKNLQFLFPTEELKKISVVFQKARAKIFKKRRTAKALHQMFFIALSAT